IHGTELFLGTRSRREGLDHGQKDDHPGHQGKSHDLHDSQPGGKYRIIGEVEHVRHLLQREDSCLERNPITGSSPNPSFPCSLQCPPATFHEGSLVQTTLQDYHPGSSVWHRMDARWKLAGLCLVCLSVVLLPEVIPVTLALVLTLIL